MHINKISNSTYGINFDSSFKSEEFYSVSSSWQPGSRPILKIRLAIWSPNYDRSDSAILYYDVTTKQEVLAILKKYEDFDFKRVEDEFEKQWKLDNFDNKGYFNTGETTNWWNNKFYPHIRKLINHGNIV